MNQRTYRAVVVASGLPVLVVCCSLLGATAAGAETVSPLPASEYTVRPVCAAPAPGDAGCLALQLVPETTVARARTHPLGMARNAPLKAPSPAEGAYGLRPQDLHSAYQLPPEAPSAQTIALVDAYNDPSAEAGLAAYDKEFGLPACSEGNGCFHKVNQEGQKGPLPSSTSKAAKEWSGEIATDIEIAHAVCQNCHILLVEANSAEYSNLDVAEETAVGLGATEISNSWGAPECGQGSSGIECVGESSAFNQTGIVITAAAGDDGYLDWDAEKAEERGYPDYPASSPHVVAVGGTRLSLSAGGTWTGETVWNGYGATGGGCSTVFTAQPWQQEIPNWSAVGCPENHRAVADVSAVGDPYTGAAIYNSIEECEYEEDGKNHKSPWCTIGGTSLASPIIAAVFALAGGAHGVEYPAQTLYENLAASTSALHDVVSGSNGECGNPFDEEIGPNLGVSGCTASAEAEQCAGKAICLAGTGYDGPSGVGAPNGITAFQPLTAEAKKQVEERKAKEKKAAEEATAAEQKRKEQTEQEERERGTSSGRSSTEGGTGGTTPTTNGQPGTTTSGTPATLAPNTSAATPSPTGSGALGSGELIPVLSGLSLTHSATVALNRAHPQASRIAFAFTLNMAARVRVRLAKRVEVNGHTRWQTLPYTLTIAAKKGRDSAHLSAHAALAQGRYRLTLTPGRGKARTLTFQVG
jgi:Subtilase family